MLMVCKRFFDLMLFNKVRRVVYNLNEKFKIQKIKVYKNNGIILNLNSPFIRIDSDLTKACAI